MELWQIVGGGEAGGILVRKGRDLKSPAEEERLAKGSEVQQLELAGDRLRYRLQWLRSRVWVPGSGNSATVQMSMFC